MQRDQNGVTPMAHASPPSLAEGQAGEGSNSRIQDVHSLIRNMKSDVAFEMSIPTIHPTPPMSGPIRGGQSNKIEKKD